MGDRRDQGLRVRFDDTLRLDLLGVKITSDAGPLPFRELDEAFRLTEMGGAMLPDSRTGKNTQHTLLTILRQAVYGRLAGCQDVNDVERLRVDPAMRRVVGGRANEGDQHGASLGLCRRRREYAFRAQWVQCAGLRQ